MEAQLEIKLIECLEALARGESLERILARYPHESAQLRPLLETAAGLSALRREPSEAAKMQSRQKFMAQADLLRRTAPRRKAGFLPRFAAGFIAAALVAIVLGTGAVVASGSALPGDPLYGLKRSVENAQLNLSSSATARESLADQFTQRRRDEVNQLLSAGRPGEVEFTGMIESLQPEAWIVSGLVVQIDANTQIAGTPQINRVAEVRGVTGPNGLWASSISIESPGEPAITPAPEVTQTPQITASPEATRTTAPTTTVTPQPTTPPRPTATPRPMATSQPVEVEFTGSVNAIDAGTWNVDGMMISVNASTEIRDSITVGQRVKVRALRYADGRLIATRIELAEDDGGGSNSNGNENQNGNDDGNSNGNDSPNGNDNGGDGGNGNENGNDNSNDDNSNDHGNSNDDNSNDNSNDNDDNSNGN